MPGAGLSASTMTVPRPRLRTRQNGRVAFTRRIEDFDCERCGTPIHGDGYTNHCAHCLWSKHVDIDPGDRAAGCGGLMAPIDVILERGRHVLVHRCTVCGIERRCRTSDGDDVDTMVEIAQARGRG
jgi:RNHCP domain